ncbi:MAG: FecR domain-containing protein, partial [Planctomycetaceae bacterium]
MNDSRLETLLEKFQDNQLSTDESRELIEWINADESRVTEFTDELRMSNAFAALHVLDADGIAPAVRDSLSRAGETTDISRSVRRHIESEHPHLAAPEERWNVLHGQWLRWWIACAAAMLLLIGWFAFPTNDTAPDNTSVIAYVAHEVDAAWLSDSGPQHGELKAGRLELQSGIVRLDFNNGASVTLQGPAAYEITGPMETRLHHGVLTARIPESAIGFTVETSAMDVVDLGTAFGVSVDRDGVTDVSVFEGSVEVRPPGSRSDLIMEGEAVRGGEGKHMASVPFDVSTYERVWPVALGVAKTTGSMRFVRPGPPWDLTTHRDDN